MVIEYATFCMYDYHWPQEPPSRPEPTSTAQLGICVVQVDEMIIGGGMAFTFRKVMDNMPVRIFNEATALLDFDKSDVRF